MKTSLSILLTIALVTAVSSNSFARNIAIDLKQAPPITLGDAYEIAVGTLGSSVKSFHCTSAVVEIAFALHGEWLFRFYSVKGEVKDVVVPFDKDEKPQVIDGGVKAYF